MVGDAGLVESDSIDFTNVLSNAWKNVMGPARIYMKKCSSTKIHMAIQIILCFRTISPQELTNVTKRKRISFQPSIFRKYASLPEVPSSSWCIFQAPSLWHWLWTRHSTDRKPEAPHHDLCKESTYRCCPSPSTNLAFSKGHAFRFGALGSQAIPGEQNASKTSFFGEAWKTNCVQFKTSRQSEWRQIPWDYFLKRSSKEDVFFLLLTLSPIIMNHGSGKSTWNERKLILVTSHFPLNHDYGRKGKYEIIWKHAVSFHHKKIGRLHCIVFMSFRHDGGWCQKWIARRPSQVGPLIVPLSPIGNRPGKKIQCFFQVTSWMWVGATPKLFLFHPGILDFQVSYKIPPMIV